MSEQNFKSGFVAIIGKPNAGKSTLLNALLGRKLVITTHKAQTTRHRILGILNTERYQIIFSDTPGVIKPKYGLQRAMMRDVSRAVDDADLILLLLDVNEKFPEEEMLEMVKKTKIPVLLVINKIDRAQETKIKERLDRIKSEIEVVDEIEISALEKKNLDELVVKVEENLPQGHPWYDPETLSDRPERFFVAEIIREKLFLNLQEELPYSCEVSVLSFNEEEDISRINAEIHVERKSQKGMIIGKRGSMLKTIGTEARKDIEEFLNKKVFLELYVRVADKWKDDANRLKQFGYEG